jgi:hypothetical protein
MLNMADEGPEGKRKLIDPKKTYSWHVPDEKGMCNLRAYLHFMVRLAIVLGMKIEDENGNAITDMSQLAAWSALGQKRVTLTYTLTE